MPLIKYKGSTLNIAEPYKNVIQILFYTANLALRLFANPLFNA